MEIHQLRYFLATARTRNFSRAAEQCNISQPALSQQIGKLEEELGDRLFERTKREVSLTAAGEVLRAHAEVVLDALGQAGEAVRAVRGTVQGTLVVGALPTVAPYYLPGVLRTFGVRFPGVQVMVHEDTTARLVEAVERKDVDLAVVSLPVAGRKLTSVPLFEEELWLALPASHRLAKKRSLALSDLGDESFILMQEGHCLAGQSLQVCATRGFAPRVGFRSAQIETVRAFVAAGLGVSLVPAMARGVAGERDAAEVDAPGESARVVYRSIAGEKPRRSIGVIHRTRETPCPLTKAFLAVLAEAAPVR